MDYPIRIAAAFVLLAAAQNEARAESFSINDAISQAAR
jgi:hypothetical protein